MFNLQMFAQTVVLVTALSACNSAVTKPSHLTKKSITQQSQLAETHSHGAVYIKQPQAHTTGPFFNRYAHEVRKRLEDRGFEVTTEPEGARFFAIITYASAWAAPNASTNRSNYKHSFALNLVEKDLFDQGKASVIYAAQIKAEAETRYSQQVPVNMVDALFTDFPMHDAVCGISFEELEIRSD